MSMNPTKRISTLAMAVALGVTVPLAGCAGVGEPEDLGTSQQADTYIPSFTMPASGYYSVVFYTGQYGSGDSFGWNAVGAGLSIAKAKMSGDGTNPRTVSSFYICNNVGSDHVFHTNLYSDFNYVTFWKGYPVTVKNGACHLINAGVGSTFELGSMKLFY